MFSVEIRRRGGRAKHKSSGDLNRAVNRATTPERPPARIHAHNKQTNLLEPVRELQEKRESLLLVPEERVLADLPRGRPEIGLPRRHEGHQVVRVRHVGQLREMAVAVATHANNADEAKPRWDGSARS